MARTLSRSQVAQAKGETITCVRYLRVSRMGDRLLSDEAFHSPELQTSAIDAEFDKLFGVGGWKLLDVPGNFGRGTWADFDVSGTSVEREGLTAALEAVALRSGAVQGLGVLNLSRWARNVMGALRRVDELEQLGVRLISAKEEADFITPTGRFATTIFLAIDQMYAEQKGEEWSQVIERRALLHGRHHGTAPTGYRREARTDGKVGGDIVVDEQTSSAVVQAFEMYVAGAAKLTIWKMLKAHNIGVTHDLGTILANKVYVRWHAPECVGTDPPCDLPEPHGDRGYVRSRDLERVHGGNKRRVGTQAWYPGRHEGIIDPDLFERVQERWNATKGERQRTEPYHELMGCVRCGNEGCYRKAAFTRSKKQAPQLRDNNGHLMGCPGFGTMSARMLLQVVMEEMRAAAEPVDDARLEAQVATMTTKAPTPGRHGMEAHRQRCIERIAQLDTQVTAGEYTEEEAQAIIAAHRREIQRLDAKLALKGPDASAELRRENGLKRLREALTRWDDLDVAARNAFIRSILVVYVGPAAWRGQPYAERSSVVFNWEDTASFRRTSAAAKAAEAASLNSGVAVALAPAPEAVPSG